MDPIVDYKATPTAVAVSQFMSRVYGWMTFGLLITAVVSYVIGNDASLMVAMQGKLFFVIILQFGLVLGINFGIKRMSVGAATFCFLLYSFLTGVLFSTLFLTYSISGLAQTFTVTSGAFAGLALYGTVTKRDLTAMGTFMMMGLWGLIIAMFAQFFFHSPALNFVVSLAGVVIFSGLTAYNVQQIRSFGMSGQTETDEGHKVAIIAALQLYLNFINLFLFLLQFMGGSRRRDY